MSIKLRHEAEIFGSGSNGAEALAGSKSGGTQEWLFRIAEKVRCATSAPDLLFEIAEATARRLDAHRCFFNEIDIENNVEIVHRDYCRDADSVAGTHPISAYSPVTTADIRSGRTVINSDSRKDPRTAPWFADTYGPAREISYVAVPLMRGGKWVASLWISDDKPRDWCAEEILLLETVAERTWTAVERLRTEKDLSFLAAIVEHSDDAIISKNLDGIITSWNSSAEQLFGYTAPEAIGRHVSMLIPPDLQDEEPKILDRIRSGEPVSHHETVRVRKDGTRVDISLTVSPIKDPQGRIIGASKIARDITEKKRAEEALLASEQRFSGFMHNLPGLAWIKDIEGRYVFVNDAAEKAFQAPRKDLIGKTDDEIFPAKTAAQFRKNDKQALESTGIRTIEILEHDDGILHHSIVSKFPIGDSNGEPVLIGGMAIDVTEEKRAEQALRESEEKFRLLSDTAPALIWFDDPEGNCLYVNQYYLDFSGKTIDEVCGTGWHLNLHPDDIDEYLTNLKAALAEQLPFYHRVRARRKDGEWRWLESFAQPLYGVDGTYLGHVGISPDITVAVEAEEAVRASQAAVVEAERKAAKEYRALLERIVPLGQKLGTARDLTSIYRAMREFICSSMACSGFFVSFYDADKGVCLPAYVWDGGEEIDIGQLPMMPITENSGPNSKAILEKRTVITNRPHVVPQDNGRDPNSSLVVPMMVKNSVIGTLEVQAFENNAFDIEHVVALEMAANLAAVAIENVRLIEEQAAARKEAEAANRTKDEFLSVLSHELRTPLNSILGWVRMYRLGIVDDAHYKQAIEVIERNANIQNGLIEDLLDVSRIISGKMRIEREVLDVVRVAGDAIEALRPVAMNKEISLELSTAIQTLFVDGDPIRLQQAISNLVQNAIKFTPSGGNIRVSIRKADSNAEIRVRDSGIGIDGEFIPHIFERFRQADASSERSFSGLGLGLTIVRTIVELHGGNISVESEGRGKGSTFIVVLPLAIDHYQEASASARLRAIDQRNLENVKILLVDDNYDNLLPLQMFLDLEGAKVTTASSAAEALDKLTQDDFNLLISDIGMPEMDGYALISKLRKNGGRNSCVPAIAVTAYASSEDRNQTRSAGFQNHISKPIEFDEVIKAIEEVFREEAA